MKTILSWLGKGWSAILAVVFFVGLFIAIMYLLYTRSQTTDPQRPNGVDNEKKALKDRIAELEGQDAAVITEAINLAISETKRRMEARNAKKKNRTAGQSVNDLNRYG